MKNSSKGAVSGGVLSPATVGGCASSRVGTLTAGGSLRAVRETEGYLLSDRAPFTLRPVPRERGILMNGDMVRATLAGIKLETRRPDLGCNKKHDANRPCTCLDWSKAAENCPLGRPGDRLYVRETHWRNGYWSHPNDERRKFIPTPGQPVHFIGDKSFECYSSPKDRTTRAWYKRPSIFMPKWAARIWLEITKVSLVHVQSITKKQAIAEGIERYAQGWKNYSAEPMYGATDKVVLPRDSYRSLWDNLYAKCLDRHGIPGGYSWAINPVVWRICFRRIQP